MVVESGMKGARSMGTILQASVPICAFMALVILFYANSFVMKRRKREFGLYSILGMEKRHISLVMLWEVLYTAVLSMVLGIICGALFSQLMFLLFSKAAHFTVQLAFQIPVGPIWWTFVLFAVIFGLVLLYDIVSVFRSDPIMLLHSDKTGEREPKGPLVSGRSRRAVPGRGVWLGTVREIGSRGSGNIFSGRTPCGAGNVLSVYCRQHCDAEVAAKKRAVLLQAFQFYFGVRYDLPHETKCSWIGDNLYFVYRCFGNVVYLLQSVFRGGGYP